jgi:hypothetical protein
MFNAAALLGSLILLYFATIPFSNFLYLWRDTGAGQRTMLAALLTLSLCAGAVFLFMHVWIAAILFGGWPILYFQLMKRSGVPLSEPRVIQIWPRPRK